MSSFEVWFHLVELVVLIFGMAAPLVYGAITLRVILKQYPPHRHVGKRIFYPKGYEPGEVEDVGPSRV